MNGYTKELKAIGEKLYRPGISDRALEIAKELIEDGSRKKAVECIGRMAALYQCCKADDYWEEKSNGGFTDEMDHLSRPSVLEALKEKAAA